MHSLKLDLLLPGVNMNMKIQELTSDLNRYLSKKNNVLIINSELIKDAWKYIPDHNLMSEYKSEIRQLFAPQNQTVMQVEKVFDQNVKPERLIVGVHLRRGDYKTFMNGRYFFDGEVYRLAMNTLQEQIQRETGNETLFLLCSDSPVNMNSFDDFNTFQVKDTSAIKDLYALSRCNYIIGPPSTFSMWASYYGDVPLRFLMSKEENIHLSDFSPIVSQNRFKNGTIFIHKPLITMSL